MTVQQIREPWARQPFVPFRIHYPGGAPVEVLHPETLAFSPTGRIAFIVLPDERLIRIDVALITALEELHVTSAAHGGDE